MRETITFPCIPQIRLYQDWLREQRGLVVDNYDALRRWSTTDLDAFWQSAWDYFELQLPTPHSAALASNVMPGAQWFPGAQVSHAQQFCHGPDSRRGKPSLWWRGVDVHRHWHDEDEGHGHGERPAMPCRGRRPAACSASPLAVALQQPLGNALLR
jgi:hypothetical protein